MEDLKNNQGVEIIIAEPVGSCTDLSATINQPLKEKFNEQLIIAPLTVLVDPMKLMDILNETPTELHKSSEYILKKQLEEADIIVINKLDLLVTETLESDSYYT
ncbi:GTP-binding protein [Acetobacterium paludosum]|uniref:GTP-binding protein n=1 Tax=Acetobacterium paludosum TaxID=52693 RepID=UPI00242BA24D|nr:GTP-binding protein [Acetobacterium paludosum]